jgi:hypothetical protein
MIPLHINFYYLSQTPHSKRESQNLMNYDFLVQKAGLLEAIKIASFKAVCLSLYLYMPYLYMCRWIVQQQLPGVFEGFLPDNWGRGTLNRETGRPDLISRPPLMTSLLKSCLFP